jgi:undecaprenyl-diphosphatase
MRLRALFLLWLMIWALPTQATEPRQPLFRGTLQLIADFPLAPLHWDQKDWLWAGAAGGAIALAWSQDLKWYPNLAKETARKDWLDNSMPVITMAGEGWIQACAIAVPALVGSERLARTSTVALQALAVSAVYAQVFKYAAWSNRPYQDDTKHELWYYSQSTQGLPSGHTFSSFAVAEAYGAEYGRWWTYSLAGLIAYSRIYNQAHWPSDVVAGAALGIAAGVQARHQADNLGDPSLRFSFQPSGSTPLLVAQHSF